jgi:hypothetical protein
MKKTKASDARKPVPDDLLPEYQFDYRKARPNRFADQININRECLVVTLDPDVSKVFTTAESVNDVLRALIAVMPSAPKQARGSR